MADMELDMVADMEVDKVANMVADEKKKWECKEEKRVPNLVRELVMGVGKLGPNFFDPKLNRLACLLSFAS